jgi:hypothetical protein
MTHKRMPDGVSATAKNYTEALKYAMNVKQRPDQQISAGVKNGPANAKAVHRGRDGKAQFNLNRVAEGITTRFVLHRQRSKAKGDQLAAAGLKRRLKNRSFAFRPSTRNAKIKQRDHTGKTT